jgi:tRNA (cytidine/uridine-2'-O-)-methyltransferase
MNVASEKSSGLHVALLEPEIPPNTGNIARLCGATYTPLHLIGKLGFRTDEKAVRRAGLDYWDAVQMHHHLTFDAFQAALPHARLVLVETGARHCYASWRFQSGDCLVFGRETLGLPQELLEAHYDNSIYIPMFNPAVRSLNLANSVSIVLYEALRQVTGNYATTI